MLRSSLPWKPVVAAIAIAMLAAVVFGGFSSPQASEASPRGITGGGLDWGVKADFRSYIVTIAGGTITPSGGVTVNGDGTFHFPANAAGTHDGVAEETSASFQGQVQFQGHFNGSIFLLDLTISDVRMELDGTSGTIVADVVSRDLDTGILIPYPDVDLVNLDLTSIVPVETGADVTWTDIPSSLTAAATPAFEGFYPTGEAFDTADVTLTLEPLGFLTWKVSQIAWTSGSLSQAHATESPAVKDPVNGFVFPTWDAAYNPVTAVTALNFDGALILGNNSFGGFRIKLDNPSITVDPAGEGQIEADVSYCIPVSFPTTTCATDPWVGPVADVTLTTFDYDANLVTVSGGQYSWTITPDWASVGNQFAQEFLDSLAPSLVGFFRATGAGSDPQKPPAPITITFDTSVCGSDSDCDGFAQGALANHIGPANTNPALDNCTSAYNYTQSNTDGNFADNGAFTGDDRTVARSDAGGNACDLDDDNDGLMDVDEATGASCAAVITNPLLADTDGDRFLDGAECTLATNPADILSKPTVASCGPTTDPDGDKLTTRIEVCFYNTDPNVSDTDGDMALDGARDGCEAASANTDRVVNSIDQAIQAGGILGAVPYHPALDINKDGAINSIDQAMLATLIVPVGQCP